MDAVVYAQPVTQPFTFSLVEHTIPHMEHAVVALGDYDNDGDLDLYLAGIADGIVAGGIYRNDGKNALDAATWRAAGARYVGVGRP